MGRKEKKKQRQILSFIIFLVVILIGVTVAVGVMGGWFTEEKVVLGEEYLGGFTELKDISAEEYEELIDRKDSFVLLVDQSGCTTADTVRGFVKDWATEKGVKVQKIMFSEMKGTSLHDYVKYYPSIVVISRGKPVGYLRADSDEDAEIYNNYEAFIDWINKWF